MLFQQVTGFWLTVPAEVAGSSPVVPAIIHKVKGVFAGEAIPGNWVSVPALPLPMKGWLRRHFSPSVSLRTVVTASINKSII